MADGSSFTLFPITNARGDVVELRLSNGNPYVRYVYDSWGNVVSVRNPSGYEITDPNHYAHQNPFRYRGYYYDAESGLYYLQSRYYDPVTGRFVNPDTIGVVTASEMSVTDKNLYAYCDNNPVSRVDVDGEYWETAFDIVSLTASALEVVVNPTDIWAWGGLAGDILDVALPFVGGIGEATKAAKVVSNVAKVADNTADTIKTTKKGWKVGDDITTLTKAGKDPKWNTVRQRYWKNEARFNSKSYSKSNIDLMKKGKAPKVMYDNGKLYSMELHHITPKHKGGSNAFSNLEKLAPWDHALKDPFRHFLP